MRVETKDFLCGICGASVQEWLRLQVAQRAEFSWNFENDLEDDAVDTEMPAGWIQILVRRVVPNPAIRTVDNVLSEMLASVPDAEKAQAASVLRQQAEAVVGLDTEPESLLEEVELTVCSTCAYTSDAIARVASIEPEAFTAASWFYGNPMAAVEPDSLIPEEAEVIDDGKTGTETVASAPESTEQEGANAAATA
jgi:hypothetical protein